MFGDNSEQPNIRSFPPDISFYNYPNSVNVAYDDHSVVQTTGRVGGGFDMTLTSRVPLSGGSFASLYLPVTDVAAKAHAAEIIAQYDREFAELEQLEPATLEIFKQRLNMLRTQSYNLTSPFPAYDLQIEGMLNLSVASPTLARAVLQIDGQDALSQTLFPKGATWYASESAAETALETALAEQKNAYEEGRDIEGFKGAAFWKTNDFSFDKPEWKAAAAKFVRYEVQVLQGFDCEGSDYTWADHTFVLIDGTLARYRVGTECD